MGPDFWYTLYLKSNTELLNPNLFHSIQLTTYDNTDLDPDS